MKKVFIIAGREILHFFQTPMATVILTIYLALIGTNFNSAFNSYLNLAYPTLEGAIVRGVSVVHHLMIPYFENILGTLIMVIPLITMRTFAEEKKLNTYDILVSYPLRPSQILLGKFLGNLFLALVLLLLSFGFIGFLMTKSEIYLPQIFSILFGYFLFVMFFVAVGVAASLSTENQIVAAIVSYAAVFGMIILRHLAFLSPKPWDQVFGHFLLIAHLDYFRTGIIFTSDVVTYLVLTTGLLLLAWSKLRRHFHR